MCTCDVNSRKKHSLTSRRIQRANNVNLPLPVHVCLLRGIKYESYAHYELHSARTFCSPSRIDWVLTMQGGESSWRRRSSIRLVGKKKLDRLPIENGTKVFFSSSHLSIAKERQRQRGEILHALPLDSDRLKGEKLHLWDCESDNEPMHALRERTCWSNNERKLLIPPDR